jgi:hypothetical protein
VTSDRRYYISVEVDAFSHPRILELGDALAFRHLGAIAWCHRHLTDGFVPSAAIAELRLAKTDLKAFVKAGLWKPVAGGWRIHDYLKHQPSKAEMRRRSDAGSTAAKVRWAQRPASESDANRNAERSASRMHSYELRTTSDSETYPRGGTGDDRSRDQAARTPGLRPIGDAVERVTAKLGEPQ